MDSLNIVLIVLGIFVGIAVILIIIAWFQQQKVAKKAHDDLANGITCAADQIHATWNNYKNKHGVADTPGVYIVRKNKKEGFDIEFSKTIFASASNYIDNRMKKHQGFIKLDPEMDNISEILIVPCLAKDGKIYSRYYNIQFNGKDPEDIGSSDWEDDLMLFAACEDLMHN